MVMYLLSMVCGGQRSLLMEVILPVPRKHLNNGGARAIVL